MALLIIWLMTRLVSVMTQSTLLDNHCDNQCESVEIQRLSMMIEDMKREVNENKIEHEHQITEFGNKNALLESELVNQKNEISSLKNVLESKIEDLGQEVKNQMDVINQLQADIAALEYNNQIFNVTKRTSPESLTSYDCEDIRALGYRASGVYGVIGENNETKEVFCEMTPDGSAWTRIMHRQDNNVDFVYKKWVDYESGFGDPNGSHWMGLLHMHQLTNWRPYKLRVNLTDWTGDTRYADYLSFRIDPASDKYRLNIGGYIGTAGDGMISVFNLNRMPFSTIDQDNSPYTGSQCASGNDYHTGGWWYSNCANGRLTGSYIEGGNVPNYY